MNKSGKNQYSNWGIMIDFKYCSKCKQIKPNDDFVKYAGCFTGLYSHCKECQHKYVNLRMQKIKIIVLTHYGGDHPRCVCCGETLIEFLTIDHIYGGGNQHLKKNKIKRIHPWLYKNNFPPGYQVLCMNCNFAKGKFGKCPHKKYKEDELK